MHFTIQLILLVVKSFKKDYTPPSVSTMNLHEETSWLSCYIYYRSSPNTLLAEQIWPLVRDVLQKGWAEHYFFIRYYDRHGMHIRLRLKGQPVVLASKVKPLLQKTFADVRFVSYRPELGRYGGQAGIAIAEQMFEMSSVVVLSFLREASEPSYEKSLGIALQLNIATAYALGMSKDEAVTFFVHVAGTDNLPAMAGHFSQQKAALVPTVTQMWDRLNTHASFDKSWFDLYVDGATKVGVSLKRAFDNKELRPIDPKRTHRGHPMWAIYESYVHMNNNRLGITNEDECYLAYILGQSFETL